MKHVVQTVLAVLLLTAVVAVPVAAQPSATPTETFENTGEQDGDGEDSEEEGEEESDNSGVISALQNLADSFDDFTDDWDQTIEEVLIAVLFAPFRTLAQQLLNIVVDVIAYTPDIHPNPAVEEIHRFTLAVTYLLSGLGIIATGLLYITGPIFGYSYEELRLVLPRIIAALVFASISPILLQYTVELTQALTEAFQSQQLALSYVQAAGLTTGLVLAWVSQSAVLLTVVVMFLIRNVYILFTAAISPLIAFGWAFPSTRPYAEQFISGYWTALAMAPLDVLALRFSMTLLQEGNAVGVQQSLSNWIIGVASFTLLIIIPYQLYGASRTAVRTSTRFSTRVKHRANEFRETERYDQWKRQAWEKVRGPRRESFDDSSENKFRFGGDDD